MALTAASTLADIYAQYVTNRQYAYHASVASALLFSEACAWILVKPIESEDRDGRVQFDRKQIALEQRQCDGWLSQFAPTPTGASGRTTKASFENFRN